MCVGSTPNKKYAHALFVRHVVVFRLLQKVDVMIAACVSIRTLIDIAFSRAR
jgi:hypothetical protein